MKTVTNKWLIGVVSGLIIGPIVALILISGWINLRFAILYDKLTGSDINNLLALLVLALSLFVLGICGRNKQ